jgi:hypothetical protein
LSPESLKFLLGSCKTLSYLDFALVSIEGRGWHAQNGMELHDLAFSIRVGAFQMDRLARLAFLALMNTKRYLGMYA